MDVKTDCLNGDLGHEIYMEQPEGYANKHQADLACRLRKRPETVSKMLENHNRQMLESFWTCSEQCSRCIL